MLTGTTNKKETTKKTEKVIYGLANVFNTLAKRRFNQHQELVKELCTAKAYDVSVFSQKK